MRGPDTLSIHCSFIVRLYPGVDLGAGKISGWVEHVVSGREPMHFDRIAVRKDVERAD